MFDQEIDPDLEKVTFLREAKPGAKFTFLHRKEAWTSADATHLAAKLATPVHLLGHYLVMLHHVERAVIEEAFQEVSQEEKLFMLIKTTVPERRSGFPKKFVTYTPL